MTTDDDMREIEAALDEFRRETYDTASSGPPKDEVAKDKLLALIRQKLPQTDAEHELAVEAWRKEAMGCTYLGDKCLRVVSIDAIERALRLMRARPAIEVHSFTGTDSSYDKLVAREKAAGELLRAARNMVEAVADVVPDEPLDELSHIFVLETKRHHWERVLDCRDQLEKAIEAAERAGVR